MYSQAINKLNDKILFGSAALLALILSIFTPYFSMLIPLLLLFPAIIFYKEKYLYNFLMILFLLITSDINETLRIVVNTLGLLTAYFVFIKNYGFEFSRYPRIPLRLSLIILALLASMILSSIFSASIITGLNWTFRQLIFFLLVYTFYASIKSHSDVSRILDSLIFVGVVLSTAIAYSLFTTQYLAFIIQTQGLIKEGGYFGNVAQAAGVLAITIPITFYRFKTSGKFKPFLFALIIFQTAAILVTNSRAAILGLFISSLFIFFFISKDSFKKFLVFASFIVLVLLIVFTFFSEEISAFLRFERVFENTRYQLWDASIGMIKDNPILGVGPGMFKEYIYPYLPVMLGSWDEAQIAWVYENAGLGHVHNFFLFKLSELGIVGLSVVLYFVYFFISRGYKLINFFKGTDQKLFLLIVSITGIGIGLFVRSFFESTGILSYGWIIRDLPLWLLISILVFYLNKRKELQSGK